MSRGSGEQKKAGTTQRRPRWSRRHAESVELITDARRSPLENWQHRKRVYAILQGARVPFLLASGVAYVWWENWIIAAILFVISVPLPWIAVVIANGVGEPRDARQKQVYKPQAARDRQREREAKAHQILASGKHTHAALYPGESDSRLELDSPASSDNNIVIEHDDPI